ncbi:unnamed protein product [Mytilus edulis]|uniref:A-kinase anchor protein 7-like phosphoesterase domain-containing protein n=1 Tax=Mytilus edulis TaxID=6550 RepID=A0A8S3PWF0_MYTED|nr:unnamed protein product [Mytilus edulis]
MSNFQKTVSAVEDLIKMRELQQKERFRQIPKQPKEVNEKLEQKDKRQVDRSRRKKPTHFISLQITNPEIITKIAEVQREMKKRNEILELAHVRLSCAHITLRVACLETEDDLNRMKKTLDDCVEQLGEMFEDCCKANGASFKKEGRFNPHLTIAKITQLKDWLELIEAECGQSLHYASNVLCIPITKCDKPTSTHLRSLGCNSTDYELPEGLLILYRSGIFSINCSSCDIYICPKHRDDFGIYWRRQTRKCQSPTHPDQSVAKPSRGIPASVCKELWMTKRISLPVGSDSECDFPLSSQSTQTFSQTTTSDWEEENMAPREIFNAAMKMLSRNFPALNSQLQLPWTSLSKSSSSYYTKIITEAIQLIAQYVAPGQENNLLTDVCKKWISLKEDKPDTMTEALIASYQQQNNRLSQMQILSLFANKHTKERLMELVPGLSVFKIDAARRHATLTFPGQLINPPKVYRSRLSMPRVMHFIEFISCPTYHQAVDEDEDEEESISSELCRGSSTLEISPKSNTADIQQVSITSETLREQSKSNSVQGFDASLQASCSYGQHPVPNSSDMYSESRKSESQMLINAVKQDMRRGESEPGMSRESNSPAESRDIDHNNADSKEGTSSSIIYEMVPDFSPGNLNRLDDLTIQRLVTGLHNQKKAKHNEWWPKINTFLEPLSVNELCLESEAYLLHYRWVVWKYKQQYQQDTIDIREIDPSTYINYRNQLFGRQQVTCLQLCSMKSDNSGYYRIEHVTKL